MQRRHVLYLGGFDPQGPAHYHGMYQREAALQAAVSGYELAVGPRERAGPHGAAWDLQWRGADGASCTTRYEFLRWDDIVRQHWPRGQGRLMGLTLATTWRLLRNGSLWRMLQTSWPAFLAIAAPALTLLGAASVMLALLAIAAHWAWQMQQEVGAALLLALGLPGTAWWAQRLQGKVQMAWLMRSASVILQQARGQMPDLEGRLDAFASRLQVLLAQPELDEVLVVGHSSGAMLAVSTVARALAAHTAPTGRSGPCLSLLTLGQCIPVLSYQPQAQAFREELRRLRGHPGVHWLDVTAPPDGCCFALADPTAVCLDGQPQPAKDGQAAGPKLISPRFAQLFRPASYRAIKADKFRCHFQYLMASELPGVYDYFAITAGPVFLHTRFSAEPSVRGFKAFQRFGSDSR